MCQSASPLLLSMEKNQRYFCSAPPEDKESLSPHLAAKGNFGSINERKCIEGSSECQEDSTSKESSSSSQK